MRKIRHSWNLTPSAAIALQHRLGSKVVRIGRPHQLRHVAGTDVGFERGGGVTRAAVAVLSFPALELVDHAIARQPTRFPYRSPRKPAAGGAHGHGVHHEIPPARDDAPGVCRT